MSPSPPQEQTDGKIQRIKTLPVLLNEGCKNPESRVILCLGTTFFLCNLPELFFFFFFFDKRHGYYFLKVINGIIADSMPHYKLNVRATP